MFVIITKSNFHGIKIFDRIKPKQIHSYFKIKINEKIKYIHKQSACYFITSNTPKLSNDRLSRVRQQTTKRWLSKMFWLFVFVRYVLPMIYFFPWEERTWDSVSKHLKTIFSEISWIANDNLSTLPYLFALLETFKYFIRLFPTFQYFYGLERTSDNLSVRLSTCTNFCT